MQLVLPEKKMHLLVETVTMVLPPAKLLTLLYHKGLGLVEKSAQLTMYIPCKQADVQVEFALDKLVRCTLSPAAQVVDLPEAWR